MAGNAKVIVTTYVIDTSYLDELFAIPNYCTGDGSIEVRKRYRKAIEDAASLFVPLPCIFEIGNHIASILQGGLRTQAATKVGEAVRSAFASGVPFTITPADLPVTIDEVFRAFTEELVVQGVGMTDAFVIREALRIRAATDNSFEVHIWTRDTALKAREPDNEADPFV